MAVFLLKLFLAPALVVASTLAGRRWGDEVAGILVALPVVAGPILFIAYALHGPAFAAAAAGSSLLGLVSLAVFAVVFARVGRRYRWLTTSFIAWLAVLLSDLVLSAMSAVPIGISVLITVTATCVALVLMPAADSEPRTGAAPALWIDLTSRAVVTAVLVLVITTASGRLGPSWTGLLAPFPTALTVVTAFVHAQQGSSATIRTLRGALIGLFGFAIFCVVAATFVRSMGAIAFLVGIIVAALVQTVVTRVAAALAPRLGRHSGS